MNEQAQQREEAYEQQIRLMTAKLKEVSLSSNPFCFSFFFLPCPDLETPFRYSDSSEPSGHAKGGRIWITDPSNDTKASRG